MSSTESTPDRAPKGLMALDGKALAKVVDDTLAALRIVNPTWLGWFGEGTAAHVQLVDRAERTDDVFVVTKDGDEAAVLIGWSTWQQMRSDLERAEERRD